MLHSELANIHDGIEFSQPLISLESASLCVWDSEAQNLEVLAQNALLERSRRSSINALSPMV